MADACGSDGFHSRIAIEESGSPAFAIFTSSSDCFPLADACSLRRRVPKGNFSGLNGSREEDSEMTRNLNHIVEGDIPLYLTPDSFQAFGPRILGGAWDVSKNSVPTTALPTSFHAAVHKDAYIDLYYNLQVTRGEISGEVNKPIMLNLGCIGRSRDTREAGADWPSGLDPTLSAPYLFEDAVFKIGGTAYKWRKFKFMRDNRLSARYWGSNTACGIKPDGLAYNTLQVVLPFSTDTVPNILEAKDDEEYLACTIDFVHPNAAYSAKITLPGLQFPNEDPPVVNGEIIIDFTGAARRVAAAAPVTFNNDNIV